MKNVRIVFKRGRSDLLEKGSIKCDPKRLDGLKPGERVTFDASAIPGDLVLIIRARGPGATPGQIFTSGAPRRIPAGGSVTIEVRSKPGASSFDFGIVPVDHVIKEWSGGGGDVTGSGRGT